MGFEPILTIFKCSCIEYDELFSLLTSGKVIDVNYKKCE